MVYGQPIKCLNKAKILLLSWKRRREPYIKSFDEWHRLVTILYAVIMHFDSLRKIEAPCWRRCANWRI
ncbi:MAG: DUF4372 domain-containing protein [Prevotella sp.]